MTQNRAILPLIAALAAVLTCSRETGRHDEEKDTSLQDDLDSATASDDQGRSDSDADADTDADSNAGSGTTGADSDAEADSDGNGDSDVDSDTDADAVSGTGAESDTDVDDHSDVDTGSDAAARSDTDIDSDVDADADSSSSGAVSTDTAIDTDSAVDIRFNTDTDTDTGSVHEADTDSGPFDSREPVYPEVTEAGGSGNVTTYGDVFDPAPSSGGACNYGVTGIYRFAAINVDVAPGDGLGQWDEGRLCGQCAEVRAKTAEGWKSTVVRIVDRCPDTYCGIDLGGLPAKDLMGDQAGRYDGTWAFIPCEGYEGVSDGPPALFVKEGSNEWWAVVQVRNPPAAVRAISWQSGSDSGAFAYATEAENYYRVPEEVAASSETVTLIVDFDFGITSTLDVVGRDLTVAQALYPI